MLKYANPTVFLGLADRLIPWLAAATILLLAVGLYGGLFIVPPDYQQGETVRIMYIHVPAAWLAMLCYTIMAVAALGTLVWRHPLADVAQKAAAPLGAAFAFICLVTGSLWGRPMWGTYWVWDGRLTSVLVLFIMYLGVIALWQTIEEPGRAARAIAILTLVGIVNLPIIKFSVECWSTLHQGASVFRFTQSTTDLVCRLFGAPPTSSVVTDLSNLGFQPPSIDSSMLWPLAVMGVAFTLLFVTLQLAAMRNEILRRRLRRLSLLAAADGAAPVHHVLVTE
jgi:heme exporter protein C